MQIRPVEENPMTQFLLSVHSSDDEPRPQMTDEEMHRGFAVVEEIERDMRAAKALVFSGRLLEPALAKVVRASRGRVKATDGPYAETKEHLGGFYILEARDLQAALGWASRVTTAIATPIEVRPFMDVHPRG
jgi:hypothetical protein